MLSSSVVSGPVFLSRGGRLVLWTNLATHPPMRNKRQRPYLLRSASNPSTSWSVASLNISRTVFVSANVSAVAVVVMSTGQALGCESHFGPWILFDGHISPRYPILISNFAHPVVHKLLVFPLSSYPVERNCTV